MSHRRRFSLAMKGKIPLTTIELCVGLFIIGIVIGFAIKLMV